MGWHPNNALASLIRGWKRKWPRATVYTIADDKHSSESDHAVDPDGTVDAGDFMAGNGVDAEVLDAFAETLRANKDPRIKYVIRRQRIFAGNDGPEPWKWRHYGGDYHGHVHVSTRQANEDDGSPWTLDRKKWKMNVSLNGLGLPTLKQGDDDSATDGYNYVSRAQTLLNYILGTELTIDGDYGPATVTAVKRLPVDGDGKTIGLKEWTILLGLGKVAS